MELNLSFLRLKDMISTTPGPTSPSRRRAKRLQGLVLVCAAAAVFGMGTIPAAAASSSSSSALPDRGVVTAQVALSEAGFYRGEIDGRSGPMTRASVLAFQKAAGLERDGVWRAVHERYLRQLEADLPERPDEPDRVEIDLTNQVGYLVKDGVLRGVFGVSSGNGKVYHHPNGYSAVANTPRGDYAFYRHIDGVRRAPLGELYRPWYFRGGFAIHGSGSVPAYPASHGCVRVTNWDADWLAGELEIGMPVHIWDGAPAERVKLVYEDPVWTAAGDRPI